MSELVLRTEQDVEDLPWGATFYGVGGGGTASEGLTLLKNGLLYTAASIVHRNRLKSGGVYVGDVVGRALYARGKGVQGAEAGMDRHHALSPASAV